MSRTSKRVLEDPFRLAIHAQAAALIQDAIDTLGAQPEYELETQRETMLLLCGAVALRHPEVWAAWLERIPELPATHRLAQYADEVADAVEG